MGSLASTFADSLAGLDVALTRTTEDAFVADLAAAVDPPAVGTPLPFDGVSLDGTEVTVDPTVDELEAATTGVTAADFAVADYGSVVVRPSAAGEGPVSLFVDRHVAVVAESDLLPDMPAAFDRLTGALDGPGAGDAILATGPSATADMGELVRGAHGPKAVHVVLLEDH